MKVNIPFDDEAFTVKRNKIAGDEVLFVIPKHMGVDWTDENSIFRSSIWRASDLKPISLGFRKFTNLGERPAFEPIDENAPLTYVEKKDGSCLIVSQYKGELIIRTRGTVDASTLPNGHEIPFLMKKYPNAFENQFLDSEEFTLLFEWETPSNFIVIQDVTEPTLSLTGMVRHEDYSYTSQSDLDDIAKILEVPRPKTYEYPNLISAVTDVEDWKGKEGIVIVDESGQIFKKVKAEEYLIKHAFKSNISIKNLRELYFQWMEPSLEEMQARIEIEYDFECFKMAKPVLDVLFPAIAQMKQEIEDAVKFTQGLKGMERKDAAQEILTKQKVMSAVCFKVLDGKEIGVDMKKKILERILPNNALDFGFSCDTMDL